MRKLLILSITLSVFLCACGSTDSSSTDSSKQEGTTTTAYSTPENDDPSSSDSTSLQQDSSEPDGSSSEKGSDPSSSETKTTAESKDSSHTTDTSNRTELVTGSIGTTKKTVTNIITIPTKQSPRSTTTTTKKTTASTSAKPYDPSNPFNKQDNKEVKYDPSPWKQSKNWIDPKGYNGGIMLYTDKIGLQPEYARGKVQRVYISVANEDVPVNMMKFHIFYDTRLTVKKNSKGEAVAPGKGISENPFTSGSAKIKEGELAFYAYSNQDISVDKRCIFTIDFIVPENEKSGNLYPIGLAYVDDGIAADCFINLKKDDAGRKQMAYLFQKGIYNGYIKIL